MQFFIHKFFVSFHIRAENDEEDIVMPVRYYPESLQALCKVNQNHIIFYAHVLTSY